MWLSNMKKTQDQIREEVQKSFPEFALKKGIWTKKLTGKTRKKVQTIVTGNMQKPPSFSKCATLSQFRKKVLMHKEVSSGIRTFNLPITISKEVVVIGSQTYNLEKYEVGKYVYPRIRIELNGKRQPLRMDVLAMALIAGEEKD